MNEKIPVRLLQSNFEFADEESGDRVGFQMLIEGKEFGVGLVQKSGAMTSRHALFALQAAAAYLAQVLDAKVGQAEFVPAKKYVKDVN
jgi:hypothetical protein